MKHGLTGNTTIHKFSFGERIMTAQHLKIEAGELVLQYFLVRYKMGDFLIAKEIVEGEPLWMGGSMPGFEIILGTAIEMQTGIELSVNPNPFSCMVKSAGEVSMFHIDSIEVEKVKLISNAVTVSYYSFRVEENLVYRLACFCFPLVNKSLWYPLMPMDPADLYHVSDMIQEYESGMFEAYRQMNEGLVKCLQKALGK